MITTKYIRSKKAEGISTDEGLIGSAARRVPLHTGGVHRQAFDSLYEPGRRSGPLTKEKLNLLEFVSDVMARSLV